MLTFRPLTTWPHPDTTDRKSRHRFKAGWSSTMALLEQELRMLQARNGVIGANFREQDLRLDGLPHSRARPPQHPGVEISFDSAHGRLVYATDCYEFWQHNVRAIALGLEALRAVDRHGITGAGQQYAGFRQLTAGGPDPDRGRRLVEQHGSVTAALRATHPDHNGDAHDFADVQAYRELGRG